MPVLRTADPPHSVSIPAAGCCDFVLRPPASLSPLFPPGWGGFALAARQGGRARARAALRLPKAKQAAVVAPLRHPPPGRAALGRPSANIHPGEYLIGSTSESPLLCRVQACYAGCAMAAHERLPVLEAELSHPALVLAQRFVQRWDLFSRQLDDGRYICVHEQLNTGHLFGHLRGKITLGTYLLDQESRARFLVLDVDEEQGWERLGHLARGLADEDIPAYLEKSRRGGHLWLFLGQAVAGRDARAFGQGLLATYQAEGVELFPKQDRIAGGPGSLIRMPFGVHRLTGRRYGFYAVDGTSLAPTIREQIFALGSPETVPKAAFEAYRASAPATSANTELPEAPTGMVSERIKAAVSVLEFVSRHVDLKPTASGAIGVCPFHDDHRPSFGVNAEGNYWSCFAGCGGGSVIDFWMRFKGVDFTTAVTELAEMLW